MKEIEEYIEEVQSFALPSNIITTILLGDIDNWFGALREIIDKDLETPDDEVVIINARTAKKIFKDELGLFSRKAKKNYMVLIAFGKDKIIKKFNVAFAKSVKDENTDFDRDLNTAGLIRMVN